MADDAMRSIPGIGPDLVGKIRQFLETGRIDLTTRRIRRCCPPFHGEENAAGCAFFSILFSLFRPPGLVMVEPEERYG